MTGNPRIDQWLWAVRLVKTRSRAARMCRSGRVRIGEQPAKPARPVHIGDIVSIKHPPIWRRYRIKQLAAKRVPVVLAREMTEEITPAHELEKLQMARRDPPGVMFGAREKGSGRPTKKERRLLEKLTGGSGDDPAS